MTLRACTNFALVASGLAMILMLFGVELAAIPFFLLTAIFAILGMIYPDDESPASSRAYCVVAIIGAALPFIVPQVRALRYRIEERARAKETAPMYSDLARYEKDLASPLSSYRAMHGNYPDFHKGKLLPRLTPQGGFEPAPPPDVAVYPPRDPFAPNLDMRWLALGGEGVLLVSFGQDGIQDMALPGSVMDPPPANPFVLLGLSGLDPRHATYDPTNGALGLGDVVQWYGNEPLEKKAKFLHDAWDVVHRRFPPAPPKKKAEDERPSHVEARRAEMLLDDGEDLAAMLLASRAINQLVGGPKIWSWEEKRAFFIRGLVLYRQGHFRAAADALVDAVTAHPNDPRVHLYLGSSYYRGGDRANAILHWNISAQMSLEDPSSNSAAECLQALENNQWPPMPESPVGDGKVPPPGELRGMKPDATPTPAAQGS